MAAAASLIHIHLTCFQMSTAAATRTVSAVTTLTVTADSLLDLNVLELAEGAGVTDVDAGWLDTDSLDDVILTLEHLACRRTSHLGNDPARIQARTLRQLELARLRRRQSRSARCHTSERQRLRTAARSTVTAVAGARAAGGTCV